MAELDVVVASIHSAFKTDPTERTIRAMRNPYVDVIGHPTGRLISRREGFAIDLNRVLQVAAETGTALEINSYWDRLDLGDVNARAAVQAGVKLSINTDAHAPEHLAMVHFGIATARRGWVRKEDVINCMPLSRFKKWQKRSRL
ncbi:MAG: DNA polymerase/3'-5' exonuclease PolX [bacterium ADurb.Bin478]|nr:MAG: DNA polymerase/3'-5' exonuclease PolX [bacterium ADurb.Bin478]